MKLSISLIILPALASAFAPATEMTPRSSTSLSAETDRRSVLQNIPSLAFLSAAAITSSTVLPQPSNAITGAGDGNLPDLPPEAARSYLQYRIPLQVATDYYLFELKDKLSNIDDWGDINQLYRTNNNKGQGQPNKIERDYINPMRILALSMPPDEAEDMRAAQFKFEKAMQKISKAVSGVRRDLPVEIDRSVVVQAETGWDEGRIALNEFLTLLNSTTGLTEMKPIPAPGPNQLKEYGRSQKKFNELIKKTKLCQNRGGPALATAWGVAFTTQLLQDSCGIPDLDEYFYQ